MMIMEENVSVYTNALGFSYLLMTMVGVQRTRYQAGRL